MSFKQGTVAASKQLKNGRWCLRFDRQNPGPDKPKSFYVELLLGEQNVPNVGEPWKSPMDHLKRVEDLGGCDRYEVLPEPTKLPVRHIGRNGEGKTLPDDIPATKIDQEMIEGIDTLGWLVMKRILKSCAKNDAVKGLTVGEVALLLLSHPKEVDEILQEMLDSSVDKLQSLISP